MSLMKRPVTKSRRISQISQSPPCSPNPAYEPIRMDPVEFQGTTCAIPVSIKQVDLDGYDMVPPVPAYHNIFSMPGRSLYNYEELSNDIAKAIEAQYGFPSRRTDARRDFKYSLLAHYCRETDEKRQDLRVSEQNWEGLRQMLLQGETQAVGFTVQWWKKTAAQRRADRAEAGGGLACCVVQ